MIIRTSIPPRHTLSRWTGRSLHTVGDQLRNVMRSIPQPVAIVITKLEDGTHHGATLSSFTSISLSPPLVSFSLRLPSRLATALQSSSTYSTSSSIPNTPGPDSPGYPAQTDSSPATNAGQPFTVSLLTQPHSPLAHRFSQARTEHENMIRDPDQWETPLALGSGLPVVKDGLGALGCRVVGWMSLNELGAGRKSLGDLMRTPGSVRDGGTSSEARESVQEEEVGSMLFLARVETVIQQKPEGEDGQGQGVKPLVYENQRYVTTASENAT